MLRLFKWLLTGDFHTHHWNVLHSHKIVNDAQQSIGTSYIQICENCGDLRRVDLACHTPDINF